MSLLYSVQFFVHLATKISQCLPPLGVGSPSRIPDDSIVASSYNNGYEPKKGRINNDESSFCADIVKTPTLTIMFGSPTLVLALHLLGHPKLSFWVTKIQVYAANQWLELPGNTDGKKLVSHSFFNNITNTSFSIKAIEGNGYMCMRIELFGINDGKQLLVMAYNSYTKQ